MDKGDRLRAQDKMLSVWLTHDNHSWLKYTSRSKGQSMTQYLNDLFNSLRGGSAEDFLGVSPDSSQVMSELQELRKSIEDLQGTLTPKSRKPRKTTKKKDNVARSKPQVEMNVEDLLDILE